MNDEMKTLVTDAAKLLGLEPIRNVHTGRKSPPNFNPADPERGDLMRVAEAAELAICFEMHVVQYPTWMLTKSEVFTKGDHQSKVLAILRAASAVYKSRGGV